MFKSKFFIIFKTLFLVIKKRPSPKTEKAGEMKNNYPINMKIPGAHLQIVMSAQISEKSMHPSLRTCVDKIMSTDGTDRQTDRVKPIYSPKFVCRGA